MHIIAVGHTPEKLERLLTLLPNEPRTVLYNGPANQCPEGAIQQPNVPGKDIEMYYQGIWLSGATRAVFVNDDVQRITDDFWSAYWRGSAIAGVANLSHWIDRTQLEGSSLAWANEQGFELRFIRTACFICDTAAFIDLYETTQSAMFPAQAFEKSTLSINPYEILPPSCAVDSNIAPYV